MLGALYACMGLIFLPFFALAALAGAFAPAQQNAANPPGVVIAGIMFGLGIFMPVFYGILGFVGGIIMAVLYNLFARWIGGIEVEVEEAPSA